MSDLTELFERDPLLLTDADIEKIVVRQREAQAQHELGAVPIKAAAKPKTSKTQDLLKDLGLT